MLHIMHKPRHAQTWEMTVVVYSTEPGLAPSVLRIREPEVRPD